MSFGSFYVKNDKIGALNQINDFAHNPLTRYERNSVH